MASNLLFACRANFSKALMTHPPTQGAAPISSANLYGLVTLTAFVIFAPVAAVAGWGKWRTAWELAMTNGYKRNTLALSVLFSGISHYLNNEVHPYTVFPFCLSYSGKRGRRRVAHGNALSMQWCVIDEEAVALNRRGTRCWAREM